MRYPGLPSESAGSSCQLARGRTHAPQLTGLNIPLILSFLSKHSLQGKNWVYCALAWTLPGCGPILISDRKALHNRKEALGFQMLSFRKSEFEHDPLVKCPKEKLSLKSPHIIKCQMSAVFIYRQIAFQLFSLQHFNVLFLKINVHYDFIIEIAFLPRVTSKHVDT